MRARYPDHTGVVEGDGAQVGYEVFGKGAPTVLLMPTWTIVHSRFWKMQVPYLARHFRVVTFDGPGNGLSTPSLDPADYHLKRLAADALAVMEATDTDKAVVVSLSQAAAWTLQLAVDAPERTLGQVFIGPSLPLTAQAPDRASIPKTFNEVLETPQGWEKYNAHHWLTHYRDFVEFFFSQCFSEPHSTKQREDCVGWALETTPDVLVAESRGKYNLRHREAVLALCRQLTAPTLVIHGDDDRVSPPSRGQALADATGGTLMSLAGSGHIPLARDPVRVNLAIRGFVERVVAA